MFRRLLNEQARARAVAKMAPLDAFAEPGYDRLLEKAAAAFSAPIALMTILTYRNLHIVAARGMDVQCITRRGSFCHHAVDRPVMMEVCDATRDPLFENSPVVTSPPHARYYIGAPLKLADGPRVGMFCLLDTVARAPASPDQRAYLASLARQAAELLERNTRIRGRLRA